MSESIGTVLEEIRQEKQELKQVIEAVEVRLTLKVEEVTKRLYRLVTENCFILEKLEEIERKGRENNIIILRLKHPGESIELDFVTRELKRLIGVEVQAEDLNNFYPLGKTEKAPIKLGFVSFLKKSLVLKNVKKLKGTNIY
ncbi:hypothetical protein JTB14_037245 [Gonioctena quinquepunctata]|nr:hypothetical protein JTB14_037245 [Gonioctena quinquepunctata]